MIYGVGNLFIYVENWTYAGKGSFGWYIRQIINLDDEFVGDRGLIRDPLDA